MENKKVGFLIIGIGAIVTFIILLFNYSLKKIVGATCSHGNQCSMGNAINSQLWLSLGVVVIIFLIGLFIMFSKPKIIIKKIKPRKKRINLSKLDRDEKETIKLLQKEDNGMFQRDLMKKLEIGKVKTTRLLDKLEAKQLIIRKRRGMNNIVLLRN